jgi:hypothetical protein
VNYPPDWSCERIALQLERYLLRTLALGDCLAIAEHVEACSGCAQRLVLTRVSILERPRG